MLDLFSGTSLKSLYKYRQPAQSVMISWRCVRKNECFISGDNYDLRTLIDFCLAMTDEVFMEVIGIHIKPFDLILNCILIII